MGQVRNTYNIPVGKSERRRFLKGVDIDWNIILNWILRNRVGGYRLSLGINGWNLVFSIESHKR
jgi:hypothetical protein